MNILSFKYGLFQYEVKDYYSVLGVPLDASARDIRLRYLKIAYQLHPDTCHVDSAEEKEKASQILSKLVNPAYENLYKDKLRKECQLILAETGRRLVSDAYQVEILTNPGKKLYAEEKNFDNLYKEMIGTIAPDLYTDIDKCQTKIALISELNLVYLIRSKEAESKPKSASASSSTIQKTPSVVTQPPAQNSPVSTNDNSLESTIEEDENTGNSGNTMASKVKKIHESAKRHQENDNLEQGIIELREALKLDPNNATTHGLIACLYIQQGNMPYARIHSKKGIGLDAEDTYVKQSQTELEEIEKKQKEAKKQKKNSSSSGKKAKDAKGKSKPTSKSKNKDEKDKKEGPKIFGIRLW